MRLRSKYITFAFVFMIGCVVAAFANAQCINGVCQYPQGQIILPGNSQLAQELPTRYIGYTDGYGQSVVQSQGACVRQGFAQRRVAFFGQRRSRVQARRTARHDRRQVRRSGRRFVIFRRQRSVGYCN